MRVLLAGRPGSWSTGVRRGRSDIDWRNHVARANVVITPSGAMVRVRGEVLLTLVVMSTMMTGDRVFTEGRGWVAARRGIGTATVTRHWREAVAVGLLDHLGKGQKGLYPVYQGTFPEIVTGRRAATARNLRVQAAVSRTKPRDPLSPQLNSVSEDHHGGSPLSRSRQTAAEIWNSGDAPPF